MCIVDKIQKAIEECQFSCGVFLDFSKVFDTVNHDILIMKLEHYGIRGIAKDWLASYLSNRKQFIFLKDVSSDQLTLSCGIPQGMVLHGTIAVPAICKLLQLLVKTFRFSFICRQFKSFP